MLGVAVQTVLVDNVGCNECSFSLSALSSVESCIKITISIGDWFSDGCPFCVCSLRRVGGEACVENGVLLWCEVACYVATAKATEAINNVLLDNRMRWKWIPELTSNRLLPTS